jgi:hypothetical protein
MGPMDSQLSTLLSEQRVPPSTRLCRGRGPTAEVYQRARPIA